MFRRLAAAYAPLPRVTAGRPLLDVLVETILSQNTSDANSHRAFINLKRTLGSWPRIAKAPVPAIERAIRSGGLSKTKAPRIRRVLELIVRREGRLSLERLYSMKTPEIRAYLTSLPGVGAKTAACVLLFGMGRPVMPVDTHVERVARRLGWASPRLPVERIGPVLEPWISPRNMLAMHLALVQHGRRTCLARRPRCAQCLLVPFCPFPR